VRPAFSLFGGSAVNRPIGETWQPLGGGVGVYVNTHHRFGTDTILLAGFSQPRRGERAVELGAGCGAIPFLWCREGSPQEICAVELQGDACAMMERSIMANGLQGRVKPVHADLRACKTLFEVGSFDVVACNPPYWREGSGAGSASPARELARREHTCTLQDVAEAGAYLLRFGGRFCLCQRPERLCDVMVAVRAQKLEPKRLQFVSARREKPPKLFLLECRRGGRPGLTVLPPLFLEDASGAPSRELREIYGSYTNEGGNSICREG
jgi:tRNA1Val (adenine37-N6)-methyltransferase